MIATPELAKRAVVFTVAGVAMFEAAHYFCGQAPKIYNTIMRVVSPVELSDKSLTERLTAAKKEASEAYANVTAKKSAEEKKHLALLCGIISGMQLLYHQQQLLGQWLLLMLLRCTVKVPSAS